MSFDINFIYKQMKNVPCKIWDEKSNVSNCWLHSDVWKESTPLLL